MIFQFLLVAFALFAIVRVVGQYRRRHVSKYWLVLWTALWLVVIAVALAPQTSDIVAHKVGVGRGADLLVYAGVVVLSYAMFAQANATKKLANELTELTRKIAIDRAHHPDDMHTL